MFKSFPFKAGSLHALRSILCCWCRNIYHATARGVGYWCVDTWCAFELRHRKIWHANELARLNSVQSIGCTKPIKQNQGETLHGYKNSLQTSLLFMKFILFCFFVFFWLNLLERGLSRMFLILDDTANSYFAVPYQTNWFAIRCF